MLQIYNSESKQKEEFKPIRDNEVSLYVCGMTVYDDCHIGHGRMLLTFDMVARYLKYRGYNLNYVRNITDIEDKIIKRANENKEAYTDLTERTIASLHEDCAKLNMIEPDQEPRATAYVSEMLDMIQVLIDKDLAYVADSGDVLYAVEKFDGYGRLSNRKLEDMQAGSRVEIDESKHNSFDFVLWKAAKPGEPFWESPWGKGRPGWHIECSAMSKHCLHEHIDIHGGGADLMFPHHENEIAQSEGCSGHKFVNYWMHNGFLRIDDEKMSKSLGNFITLKESFAQHPPEVLRYLMLSSQYRSPLNYSEQSLENAHQALQRFYQTLRDVDIAKDYPRDTDFERRFKTAMDDDFNTPVALSVLFELAKEINLLKGKDDTKAQQYAALLKELAGVLGFLQADATEFLQSSTSDIDATKVEALIAKRNQARADKDWSAADAARDQLQAMGVILEDSASGTSWRVG